MASITILLGWVPEDVSDPVAVNGVRMISAALNEPLSLEDARAVVASARNIDAGADPPTIGTADTTGQLNRAAKLAHTYGLTLVTDSGDLTPEQLHEAMSGEDEADVALEPEHETPDFDPDAVPIYRAGLLALGMMAATEGNPAGALQLANTLRHAYNLTAAEDDDSPEDWDDVLRVLFDAFPIQQNHGDIKSLAREVGR